jgi:glucosyl-3-phosphoglycerate synthase
MEATNLGPGIRGGGLWPVGSFTTADALARKGAHAISVVIPAKDEAATVAGVVGQIWGAHGTRGGSGLVDELVVVDDGSSDETTAAARAAGADVLRLRHSIGKGPAMAEGARRARGDLIVYLDADVTDTDPAWIPQLVGPLLLDERVELVKGFYQRPFGGQPTGGGRVTELAARPALSLLFPELADVLQPLAGETAARRATLLELRLEPGYGVEIGLLIDVAERYGAAAIAQVDLGRRTHRNRPLHELGPMAREVLLVALSRAGARALP